MGTKRRTKISIETHRVIVISGLRKLTQARCERCNELAEMLTPEEAAAVARVSTREVCGWAEIEKIHTTKATEESLMICLKSLLAVLRTGNTIQGMTSE